MSRSHDDEKRRRSLEGMATYAIEDAKYSLEEAQAFIQEALITIDEIGAEFGELRSEEAQVETQAHALSVLHNLDKVEKE